MYTADGETYYRFHILDRDLTKAVLTFEEANERGILDSLLEKHLEDSYAQIRSKILESLKRKRMIGSPLKK